ncbi:MAG: cyclic nucleotide-binding domain-containing protein [Bacteroidia bacterium]|jgi:CRP-like cAMP-binding protein|nr:cyclic nucleotide-binding domain-containing protein [Bacteroidia bacterium]
MDNTSFIKSIFDPYFEAPAEVWHSFAAEMSEREFRKNQLIKQSGQKEDFLNIIAEGSAGIFMQQKLQTICLDLCYERDVCCDYMSFLTRQKTPLYVQALEPVKLLSISHTVLQHIYDNSLTGNQIGRSAAEALFVHKQNQQIELLTLTAEERYYRLMEKQPQIILRTPSKHIASYLGITPESISRIRKNTTG